jgi:hypothetical protein
MRLSGRRTVSGRTSRVRQDRWTARELNAGVLSAHLSMHYGRLVTDQEIEDVIKLMEPSARHDGMRIALG